MQVIPKGRKCDPCCSDWKAKLQELWEKYQNVVRGVKFGNQDTSYPDGDGIIIVDTSGLITVDDALSGSSENPVQNKVVKNKFDTLEGSISSFDSRIDQNADNIDTLEGSISDAEIAINALQSAIVTAQNTIIQLQNTQSETRAIANAAKDTADAMDSRMDDAEANIQTNYDRTVANEGRIDTAEDDIDALESGKVDKLTTANLNAYTHNGSTQGEVAVVDGTTASTIPVRDANGRMQAADPASEATDKSLVTANWVSQTGDSAPNNVVHRTGNESKQGIFEILTELKTTGIDNVKSKGNSSVTGWHRIYEFDAPASANMGALIGYMGNTWNTAFFIAKCWNRGNPELVDLYHTMQSGRANIGISIDSNYHVIIWCYNSTSQGYSRGCFKVMMEHNNTSAASFLQLANDNQAYTLDTENTKLVGADGTTIVTYTSWSTLV